jgi:hypothetical protein
LGDVFGLLKKCDKKLSTNPSYTEAKSKAAKRKELQAPSLIRQIVQEELKKANRVWFLVQRDASALNRDAILWNPPLENPEDYVCLLKLKSFPEEEEKWFKQCLWPQINKRAPELLPKLRKFSPHRVKYLKDCYGQFRDVSQSIARKMARSFTVTVAGTS